MVGTGQAATGRSAVVETTAGRLQGVLIDGVSVFRGIRYADTTAGANRFTAPRPPVPWTGVRDVVTPAPSAPQNLVSHNTDPFYAWYSAIEPVGEDCLGLNVFTPATGAGRRPVLFWIHGGGWREYSGTAPGFDGTNLARAEDVVVVCVNHRLAAFGFIHLGDDERFADSTNAGLLDIVAALKWVRGNAEAFGGDPDNVTVFGESGGASKIAAILSMRAAKGLFHKAIVQSSGGGKRLSSAEDAARLAQALARELGQDRVDGTALQTVPMDTLLAAMARVRGTFRGTIDGRVFDCDPFHPTATTVSTHVPLLAGCTAMEATYYLRNDDRNFALGHADIVRRLGVFIGADAATIERIVAAYRAEYPQDDATGLMVRVATDYIFNRTTMGIAALQAAVAAVPVYGYLFAWHTPIEGGRMRSPHTCEVPFIFGTTDAAAACVGTGPDLAALTTRMMATWAAFARTGNPNNPTMPAWAPYSDSSRATMVIDTDCRLEVDPGGQARASLDAVPPFGYGNPLDALTRD